MFFSHTKIQKNTHIYNFLLVNVLIIRQIDEPCKNMSITQIDAEPKKFLEGVVNSSSTSPPSPKKEESASICFDGRCLRTLCNAAVGRMLKGRAFSIATFVPHPKMMLLSIRLLAMA